MTKVSYTLLVLASAATISGDAQAQTYSVLRRFQFFPHGAGPGAPLLRGLRGVSAVRLMAFFAAHIPLRHALFRGLEFTEWQPSQSGPVGRCI